MKRLFTLIFMSLIGLGLWAADSLTISYCGGELATASTYGRETKGEVSAAIFVPAATVGKYTGNNIVAVRAGITSRLNIDSLRVWVRSTLTGEDLASGISLPSGTPKLQKGWNDVALSEPLAISAATGDLYIGYTYYCRNRAYAVSVVGEGQPGTSFVNTSGSFADLKDAGVLSIEGVVTGNSLPSFDLGLTRVALGPDQSGTGYYADLSVSNLGTQDVSGFDVTVSRGAQTLASLSSSEPIARQEQKKVHFTFSPSADIDPGDTILFTISALADGTDADMSNNSVAANFIFERNCLAEEFTTERCVNCPRVAGYFHDALESKAEYATRVVGVCHHAGYYTDWLTEDCDQDLTALYTGGVYAPAMMVNRMAYWTNGSGGADNVFLPTSAQQLETVFDYELERGANCFVRVEAEPNADTSSVTLTITGQKNLAFDTTNKYLFIYVTEDNIKAQSQSGAEGTFYHQHVIRAYNSSWGDNINWQGNSFTATYTYKINKGDPYAADMKDIDAWKTADLQFVAAIGNRNLQDYTDMGIENVGACRFSTVDAIHTATVADNRTVERFDASGRRLSAPQKGLNIVRMSDGTVKKVMVK